VTLVLVLEFLELADMINSVDVEWLELHEDLIDVMDCKVKEAIVIKDSQSFLIFILIFMFVLVTYY
jgi:hypothetical protein